MGCCEVQGVVVVQCFFGGGLKWFGLVFGRECHEREKWCHGQVGVQGWCWELGRSIGVCCYRWS